MSITKEILEQRWQKIDTAPKDGTDVLLPGSRLTAKKESTVEWPLTSGIKLKNTVTKGGESSTQDSGQLPTGCLSHHRRRRTDYDPRHQSHAAGCFHDAYVRLMAAARRSGTT